MLMYLVLLVLLGNSGLLIYALFSHQSQDLITQISAMSTLALFWISEYFAESKCDANGIIQFIKKLSEKNNCRNVDVILEVI